jgi:hypothetical protein
MYDSLIDAPLFSIDRRFASFILGISPFQWFQSFHRFAPFKALRRFKVQKFKVLFQSI